MPGYQQVMRDVRSDKARTGYVVIVRGPDGRPRFERFNDVSAYRARLVSLGHSENSSMSVEELAGLLDT
jgi:Fe2+ transport system protein FeoA